MFHKIIKWQKNMKLQNRPCKHSFQIPIKKQGSGSENKTRSKYKKLSISKLWTFKERTKTNTEQKRDSDLA